MTTTHHNGRFKRRQLCVALATCFASAAALANPTGGQVVTGAATFSQNGSVLTVTNAGGTIIHWQGFSIAPGETTQFIQPSATSSVLNRVVTNDPSAILGTLQSNGQVFLINPAGILVGPGARIDVGRFVASSLQMADADFLAGRFIFQPTPGAGPVRNEGAISTPSGGSVYLIAPKVENAGLISTPGGETILAAGQSVQIGDTGTPGVRVEITGADSQATNVGTVVADAGRIGLVGALVKNSGTLNASSAVAEGGRIFLRATSSVEHGASGRIEADGTQGGQVTLAAAGKTEVEGTVSAVGTRGAGGRVEVLGDKVGILGHAAVDASGAAGGGQILVGGDFQGKNADVPNASVTYFGRDARLTADGTDAGNGGKVIVWADDTTRAYGSISAQGGTNRGDGGFVETSGYRYLDFDGRVNTSAPKGKTGMLLLDPADVTIYSGADSGSGTFSSPPNIYYSGGTNTSYINWNTLVSQLAGGTSVTVTTDGSGGNGDITFAVGSYGYTSTNTLAFWAHRDVKFLGGTLENYGNGAINVIAGWNGVYGASAAATGASGSLLLNQGARIRTPGAIDIRVKDDVFVDATTPGGTVEITGGGAYQNIQAGGMVKATGGTGGQAVIQYTGSGTQTISAGLGVEVRADTSGAGDNYWAHISSNGSQNISTPANILVSGGGVGGTPGSGNYAEIRANGTQQISANNISLLAGAGATTSTGNHAQIVQTNSAGSQTVSFSGAGAHTLALNGGSSSSGASAQIRSEGSQSIGYAAGTLNIYLTGGTSSANGQSAWAQSGSGSVLMCSNCATHNEAQIDSRGAQNIQASSITIQGGSGGNGNSAGIQSDGAQTIMVSGALQLTGGINGGIFVPGHGVEGLVGNEAHVGSDTSQTVNAGSISLTAGTGTSGVFGAYLTAPNQTITATGDILLSGGGSNTASIGGLASAAIIGYDDPNQIAITAGGRFQATAGSGTQGGALVGSIMGNTGVTIQAQEIRLVGNTAFAGIGTFDPLGTATIGLTATGANGVKLEQDSRLLANASGGNVTINHGALLNQDSGSRIIAKNLAVSGSGAINLAGNGNRAEHVSLATSTGNITYTTDSPTNVNILQATTGSGNITLSSTGGDIGLHTVSTSAANTVAISARNAIVDANGHATVNVTGGNISLSSALGNAWGGIAVSADVASGGAVNVNVPAAAGNGGGIRLHSMGASAPSSVNLNDLSPGGGDINFLHDGNLVANAGYQLHSASGSVFLGALGDVTISGASISGPAGVTAIAGNNLVVSSSFAPSGSLTLGAPNNVTFLATVDNTGSGDAFVDAANVMVGSGGALKSNNVMIAAETVTVGGQVVGNGSVDIISGELAINGGTVKANTGDVIIDVVGNLKMTGGLISAGNEVSIAFDGPTSTFYLNEFAAQPIARVVSGTANPGGLVQIDFPGRGEGGIVIDGVPGFATSGGSGFYNGGLPATLGGGLVVAYGSTTLPNLVVSDLLSIQTDTSITSTDSVSPGGTAFTTSLLPAPSASAAGATTSSAASQSSGEFGGGSATTSSSGATNDGQNRNKQQRRAGMCR